MQQNDSNSFVLPTIDGYLWRPLQLSDAEAMRQLQVEAYTWGGFVVDPLDDFIGEFDNPNTDAAKDSIGLFREDGKLIAYGWVLTGKPSNGERRFDCLWGVHPDSRETEIPGAVLGWTVARTEAICRELPADGEVRWLNVWCYADDEPFVALFERNGFAPRWSEYFMRRSLEGPIEDLAIPEGYELVPWTKERDELMRLTSNRAFADRRAPGDEGIDEEKWQRYYTGTASFAPDTSYILMHEGEGVAYVRSLINADENRRLERTEGEIGQIAVVPEHRRRGLASILLHRVMRNFKALGLDYAKLNVEINNAAAYKTYEHLGFVANKRYISYRKTIGE